LAITFQESSSLVSLLLRPDQRSIGWLNNVSR
jgi:hypothetical protein